MNKIHAEVFASPNSIRKFLFNLEHAMNCTRQKPGQTKPGVARRLLAEFGQRALQMLDSQVFRNLIIREIYTPLGQKVQRALALPLIVQTAGTSMTTAKQFAKLLLRATFFTPREPECPTEEEMPDHFSALCLCGEALESISCLPKRPEIYNHSYGYIHQLARGAIKGDKEAEKFLRLLFLSNFQFGYHLHPLPKSEFDQGHLETLFKAISTEFTGAGSNFLPFPCADSDYAILKRIFDDEFSVRRDESITASRKLRAFDRIPLLAYEKFLSSQWDHIAGTTDPHLVLTNGQDKIKMDAMVFASASLQSFSFVREDPPDCKDRFCCFPKIHVQFYWDCLGEKDVTTATIMEDGEIRGFCKPVWPAVLHKILWIIVLDAYAHIVLPKTRTSESSTANGDKPERFNRERRRRKQGETVLVHPHFRNLAEGWQASQEQIDKAIAFTGHVPPEGKTFVDQFDRGFPGAQLPNKQSGSLWDQHQQMTPVLTYGESALEELLEDVRSFATQ